MAENPIIEAFGNLLPDEDFPILRDDDKDDEDTSKDTSDSESESKDDEKSTGDQDALGAVTKELETLKAQNEALKQAQDSVTTELKRYAGRVQSIADRMDQNPSDDLQDNLRKEFGAVYEVLSRIAEDETLSLPSDLRSQVRAAADKSREQTQADATVKAIKEQVAEALKGVLPTKPAQVDGQEPSSETSTVASQLLKTQLYAFQLELENDIRARGLDPDDDLFDWKAADRKMKAANYSSTVMNEVREEFKTATDKAAEVAKDDKARESNKTTESPGSAGAGATGLDKLGSASLDEGLKLLREIGAI